MVNQKIRRRLWMLFWVCIVIFPAGWVARMSDPVNAVFYQVFSSDWTHIIAHLVLFSIFAFIWFHLFPQPDMRTSLLRLVVVALLVGGLQESMQYLTASAHKPLPSEIAFDLAIDLAGVGLGTLLFSRFRPYRRVELSPNTLRRTK